MPEFSPPVNSNGAVNTVGVNGGGEVAWGPASAVTIVDDFETGDLSKWTSPSGTMTFSVTTSNVFEGTYGMQHDANSSAYVSNNINSPSQIRYHIYFTALDRGAGYPDIDLVDFGGGVTIETEWADDGTDILYQVGTFTPLTTVADGIPTGEYLQVDFTNIDYANDTYDLEVSRASDGTSYGSDSGLTFTNDEPITEFFVASDVGGWVLDYIIIP